MIDYPKPRLSRARTRSFKETIVFIHHFGGHGASTKRHQEFVNELGFDCVSFTLDCEWKPSMDMTLREVWAEQLSSVLDQTPGDKIIYSFSSLSMTVPYVLVEDGRRDIRAWICDGGPFLEMFHCFQNYYTYQKKLTGFENYLATVIGYVVIGAVGLGRKAKHWLQNFPPDFPVLSIRAGRDKLVPARAIEKFFVGAKGLKLQRLEIPEAQHLEGLKNFPEVYKPVVKDFLLKHASPLKEGSHLDFNNQFGPST